MELIVTPDAATAAEEGALWIARQLRNAVRRRGRATMAVSGGTTPAAMFAVLADLDVPWRSVVVHQVDERLATDGDPARNASLLEVLPAVARRTLLPVTAARPAAAARRAGAALPDRFDVVHLGLGDDGHTASWPPGDPVIDEREPVALSQPYRGHVRMTVTPPVVNGARHRLVLVAGADKSAALAGWLLGRADLPVQRVRRTDTVVVADRAAAARLPLLPG